MLWHAVRAVCVPPVAAVFVVLAPDDAQFAQQDWGAFADKVHPLYCGGETRRDSVYNGLVAMASTAEPDDWVLVHDAARPCLLPADLQKLISEAAGDPVGAILALPAADTVKIAARDEGGVPRSAGAERVIDRRAAIRDAVATARAGDVVLVAGKGHETGQIIGDRAEPFDDRVVAREAIEGRAS